MTLYPQKKKRNYILKVNKKIPIYKFTTQQGRVLLVYFENWFPPSFWEVNSYSNNIGAKKNSIIFPPSFMLLVHFYMHNIM